MDVTARGNIPKCRSRSVESWPLSCHAMYVRSYCSLWTTSPPEPQTKTAASAAWTGHGLHHGCSRRRESRQLALAEWLIRISLPISGWSGWRPHWPLDMETLVSMSHPLHSIESGVPFRSPISSPCRSTYVDHGDLGYDSPPLMSSPCPLNHTHPGGHSGSIHDNTFAILLSN